MSVRVVRPVPTATPARRRNGSPAVERSGDVAVGGARALRPVHVVETHVPDREAQVVELSEHGGEPPCRVTVHDELPRVLASVEAPVGNGEQPQLRERRRDSPASRNVRRDSARAAREVVGPTSRATGARPARAARRGDEARCRVQACRVRGRLVKPAARQCHDACIRPGLRSDRLTDALFGRAKGLKRPIIVGLVRVGQGRVVGRVEAGGEAVDGVAGPRQLRELSCQRLRTRSQNSAARSSGMRAWRTIERRARRPRGPGRTRRRRRTGALDAPSSGRSPGRLGRHRRRTRAPCGRSSARRWRVPASCARPAACRPRPAR